MSEKYISKENLGLVVDGLKTEIENDWNENDKNKTGYIKNRTHWEEREYVTFVDNFDSSADKASPKCNFGSGEKYDVTWNGVLYEGLVCYYNDGYNCIGGDGYPFYIDDDGGNSFYASDIEDETKSYVISISGYVNNIHQLDTKFIPQTIQRKINGKRNQIVCFDDNANITALDRFDYGYKTSGSSSVYTVTINGITSLERGLNFTIIPHITCSSVIPKLNLNGLGEKNIYRYESDGGKASLITNVAADWIVENKPIHIVYDGDCWIADSITRPVARDLVGNVPIASGGTGASTVEGALKNLGITNGWKLMNGVPNMSDAAYCQKIIYAYDKFFAVNNSSFIKYSEDGIFWNEVNTNTGVYDIIYNEKDKKLVGVCGYGNDIVQYSNDGLKWYTATLPSKDAWISVAYGKGKYIAIANDVTSSSETRKTVAAYSTDVYTWKFMSLPDSTIDYNYITYCNDKFLMSGDNILLSSTDGTNWTSKNIGITFSKIIYANGKYVGISIDGNYIYYSTNASTWTKADTPIGFWRSIVYGKGLFVVVGSSSSGKFENTLLYSTNGSSWTAGNLPESTEGGICIAYGNGHFIATPVNKNVNIVISNDGINWQAEVREIMKDEEWITDQLVEVLAHTHDEYIPSPATAKVGQTIRVKAVDENNLPIEWETVDVPDKLSDFENDLFYNKKIPFLTLTKSDFQEWVNPDGVTNYLYTGSPKIDWVTSEKDIAFTVSATTINNENMNLDSETETFTIQFTQDTTDDGESVWFYETDLFAIFNGVDSKNYDAFLSKDEYTVMLFMDSEIFAATTDLNIELFRVNKKIIDNDVLPKMVGMNVTGTEYTINDITVTANEGAEIFNNYANNIASGSYSHAEGGDTKACGSYSHAEGYNTNAFSDYSHAEGKFTKASHGASHAEGSSTIASGDSSHAEGSETTASGRYSHAEGWETTASGSYAHAEGLDTTASGSASHTEGYKTTASKSYSHAEGWNTTASDIASHAEGNGTTASSDYQHAQGKYNIVDSSSTYAHIVGNGSSSARSNAHTLDWSGNAWFAGDVYVGSTSGTNKDEGSVKLVKNGDTELILTSSTAGSTKKFRITIDDNGVLTTEEVSE